MPSVWFKERLHSCDGLVQAEETCAGLLWKQPVKAVHAITDRTLTGTRALGASGLGMKQTSH